jgi:molybdate transport system ATP-binding protein
MLKINLKSQMDDFILSIDETLPSQKITSVFGSSGAGKSHFFRQLLGLEKESQIFSYIKINARLWQDTHCNHCLPTHQRGIGYLPQSIDLFPHLTVKQNIFFAHKESSLSPQIQQCLLILKMNILLPKYPYQLSGGQKQRVAFARALIHAKQLLLLDEPFSAMGDDHKYPMMECLRLFHEEKKIPILFSSHNKNEHSFLSDHLIIIKDGKIQASDSYHKIANHINGSSASKAPLMNYLTAKVKCFHKEEGVNELIAHQSSLWLTGKALKSGKKITLSIQSNEILISTRKDQTLGVLNRTSGILMGFIPVSDYEYTLKIAVFRDIMWMVTLSKKLWIELQLKKGMHVDLFFIIRSCFEE